MQPFPVQTPPVQPFPVQTPPVQPFPVQTPFIQSVPEQTPPMKFFAGQGPNMQLYQRQSLIETSSMQPLDVQLFPMGMENSMSAQALTPMVNLFPCKQEIQAIHFGEAIAPEQEGIHKVPISQAHRQKFTGAFKMAHGLPFIFPEIMKYKYEIHNEVLVEETDKKQDQTDVCNWLLQSLSDKQEILESYLSSELETTVVVDKIDGNVVHLSTDDEQDSEVLHFLSDTGLLASMIQYKLDFKKEHFCFDKIMLKVKFIKVAENTSYGYLHLKTMTKLKRQNQQPEKCKRIKIDYKK